MVLFENVSPRALSPESRVRLPRGGPRFVQGDKLRNPSKIVAPPKMVLVKNPGTFFKLKYIVVHECQDFRNPSGVAIFHQQHHYLSPYSIAEVFLGSCGSTPIRTFIPTKQLTVPVALGKTYNNS